MAKLRKCGDCGREMSKRAKVCPGCGASNRGQYGIGRSIVVAFLGLVILMVVGVCVHSVKHTLAENAAAEAAAQRAVSGARR